MKDKINGTRNFFWHRSGCVWGHLVLFGPSLDAPARSDPSVPRIGRARVKMLVYPL